MALPASDNFTGADGTALTAYNPAWTVSVGGFQLFANSLMAATTEVNLAHWSGDTFSDDQYSEARLASLGGTNRRFGVAVRVATNGSESAYIFLARFGVNFEFFKRVNGSQAMFSTVNITPTVGMVLRIEAEGSTIRAFIDGALVASAVDSDLASGSAGLYAVATSNLMRMDDWEGGNLGAPPMTTITPRRMLLGVGA